MNRTLGQRIQAGRKAVGLSQEALGERLEVTRQAVSKWETDGAVPELDKLVAMSRLFGMPLGVLLGVEPTAAGGAGAEHAEEEKSGSARLRRVKRLGCALLAAALLAGFAGWGLHMERRLAELKTRIAEQQQMLHREIAGLRAQETPARIMGDAGVSVEDFDMDAKTLTLRVRLQALERPEDLEVRFSAVLSDGRVETAVPEIKLDADGAWYTVQAWEVPMDETVGVVAEWAQDGVTHTRQLDTLRGYTPEGFRPAAKGRVTAHHWNAFWPVVRLKELNLELAPENGRDIRGPRRGLTAVELCLCRNGGAEPELAAPVAEALKEWNQSGRAAVQEEPMEIEFELAPGDEMVVALRMADGDRGEEFWSALAAFAADARSGTVRKLSLTAEQMAAWEPGMRFEGGDHAGDLRP